MRTKHIFAFIKIRYKDEVGTVKDVIALQYFYWPFQGDASFLDPFCYLWFVFVCHTVFSVPRSLVVTCWERADLLVLLNVMFSHFPIWCLVLGVVLSSWCRCLVWTVVWWYILVILSYLSDIQTTEEREKLSQTLSLAYSQSVKHVGGICMRLQCACQVYRTNAIVYSYEWQCTLRLLKGMVFCQAHSFCLRFRNWIFQIVTDNWNIIDKSG